MRSQNFIDFLRIILSIFSTLGIIFSVYVNPGNDPQCAQHMKSVSLYYMVLSILFMIHFALLLYNTICLPFSNSTLIFCHYTSTSLTLVMISLLLMHGIFICSIFQAADPIPLMACTTFAAICLLCTLFTFYYFIVDGKHKLQQKVPKYKPNEYIIHHNLYYRLPRVKLLETVRDTLPDKSYI